VNRSTVAETPAGTPDPSVRTPNGERRAPASGSRTPNAERRTPGGFPPWHWWRTVFFLIPAIGIYTIVLGTISILSSLVDRSGDFGHRCARLWSRLILRTTGVRAVVRGAEYLDSAPSFVLASNHQSIYDIPILFASLPLQLRIVAKASLGSVPFLGWHLQRTGHLLVDRRNPGADIVQKMRRLVSEAHSLIVFPEGTRSVDGRVGRFKKGSFLVAIDAGLPVVPVSVSGSRHVMLKGRLMVCPGEVRVTVHEPIPTRGVSRDQVVELASRVRAEVRRVVDEPAGE
jgi:1-acyl-sn-glycerol-3-phosphate acyltransferase